MSADVEQRWRIKQLAMRMYGRSARPDAWWAVEEMWDRASAPEQSLYLDCARIAMDWLVRPQSDSGGGYLHTRVDGVRVKLKLDGA
jgi:hypothetical protein